MRKFGEIYKEKVNESETLQENRIIKEFAVIYDIMLKHYGLNSVHQLNEESQLSFLTELNRYWNDADGLTDKGKQFIEKRSMELNENSTAIQKKNYLKDKTYAVINESLRLSNMKYRLYDVIDEMYNQLNASDLSDILTPDMITNIIFESFTKTINEFTSNIHKELSASVKPKKKLFLNVKK